MKVSFSSSPRQAPKKPRSLDTEHVENSDLYTERREFRDGVSVLCNSYNTEGFDDNIDNLTSQYRIIRSISSNRLIRLNGSMEDVANFQRVPYILSAYRVNCRGAADCFLSTFWIHNETVHDFLFCFCYECPLVIN